MIVAALLAMLGAIEFVEEQIDGMPFYISGRPWQAGPAPDFLQHDLDGDGAVDLILPEQVRFQRAGRFPADAAAKVPHVETDPECEAWNGALYLRHAGGLWIVRWTGDQWETEHGQQIEWPAGRGAFSGRVPGAPPRLHFNRFLHDLTGDGVPEIVLPVPEGLQVYRLDGAGYREGPLLRVFPEPEWRIQGGRVWPPEARLAPWSSTHQLIEYFVDVPRITVLYQTFSPRNRGQWQVNRFELDQTALELRGAPAVGGTRAVFTGPSIQRTYAPYVMRNDGAIGFIHAAWLGPAETGLPSAVYEIAIASESGDALQQFRARGFYPCGPLVDFNGNGRLDLVLESSSLLEGGVRSIASKFMTGVRAGHRLAVHFQDAEGRFPREPDLTQTFELRFARPPIHHDASFARYFSGERVNYSGDVTGNGMRDVIVHEWPDQLLIHPCDAAGISRAPAARATIKDDETLFVWDVDGDGRSDLVLNSAPLDEEGRPRASARVLLTRERDK